MKFNLTITEMTDEEFAQVAKAFNITPCVEVSKNDIVLTDEPIVPVEEPVLHGPTFDKNGLPWDERIHSSNHKLTDKGVWQRRRGITDMEFERVKNELLGLAPEAPLTTPVEPVQPQVVAPTPLPVEPALVASTTPVQPQVIAPAPIPVFPAFVSPVAEPTPAVAPAQPTVDANILFQTMFEKIKAGMAAGVVKANDVQNLVNAVNAQFGTQYQALAAVKDNVDVLQYIINDLVSKGL